MINNVVSFVGAGRVGSVMCRELFKNGFVIDTIISASETGGQALANECKASWTSKLTIPETTDIVIVAVPDRKLKSILGRLKCKPETIVAHTAGSIGLDIFPDGIVNRGVIYPLQTFSHNRKVNFRDLPVFIESSNTETSSVLAEIAGRLGARIYYADTEHRRKLHLAAVFACNFTNHMMTLGKELAENAGYTFEEMKPLIQETFVKAFEAGPENSQTGPAVRNDKNTVRKHLELLSFDRDLQIIYRKISKSIYKYHKKK
ncbi:MAG: DUF2520 domain-containing protein [Bacteroidetes bacterium]|nr:DUF2520 domain-containing protein [Bacteroidota bacterium]